MSVLPVSFFTDKPKQGVEFPIWPGAAPGSENADFKEEIIERSKDPQKHDRVFINVITPTLRSYWPAEPNGVSVIIIPGGSYQRIVIDKESEDIAAWLNSIGITAFILKYRLPINKHKNPESVPFMDGQRAVRLIRSKSLEWNILSGAIGVIGFSAGAQCAASIAIFHSKKVHEDIDTIDAANSRPDFMIHGYGNTALPGKHSKSFKDIDPIEKLMREFDALGSINSNVPPAFIFHADDDPVCSSIGSAYLYTAYKEAGASAELHIFKSGGHGFGIRDAPEPAAEWPSLCSTWMKLCGFIQ